MNDTKKAVIYCRVSTKEQVEEGNSLQTQEKICKEYAHKNGYDIAEVFIEQGESAKTAQRTELQRLLNYCAFRKNNVKAVIAYKIDRISRNTDDYSHIRILLKRYGVEIKSTSEYFENTPAGRFMENIIANVAQFDNDVRTERCVGGLREAVKEGRYVWGASLGYDNSKIAGKSNIVPNHLAPLIKKAFEMIASGLYSVDEVHRTVTKAGLLTRAGKPTSKSHFHRILRNEIYCGWINKFGERYQGIFKPIISEALFASVQNILSNRKRTMGVYQLENPDFPLRRFTRNEAGIILTGSWCKGRKSKYPYYRFKGEASSIRKEIFETKYIAFANQYGLDAKQYRRFRQALEENLNSKTKQLRQNEVHLKQSIADLKNKQRQIIQKNIDGLLSDAVLKEQSAILEREILDLELRLATAPTSHEDFGRLMEEAADFLRSPGTTWAKAPFEQKIRLQWFQFPFGVTFDGEKFRTAKMCSLFNVKWQKMPSMYLRADSNELRSNTLSSANSPPSSNSIDKPWAQIGHELIELEDIFNPKEKKPDHKGVLIDPEEYFGLTS